MADPRAEWLASLKVGDTVGDDHDGNITSAATAIAAIVQAPGLRAEHDTLAAEIKRLREELGKPVAREWTPYDLTDGMRRDAGPLFASARRTSESGDPWGWRVGKIVTRERIASGPETGDAGRHAADLALLAAGYRLVGGVHPLPDEVPDGT